MLLLRASIPVGAGDSIGELDRVALAGRGVALVGRADAVRHLRAHDHAQRVGGTFRLFARFVAHLHAVALVAVVLRGAVRVGLALAHLLAADTLSVDAEIRRRAAVAVHAADPLRAVKAHLALTAELAAHVLAAGGVVDPWAKDGAVRLGFARLLAARGFAIQRAVAEVAVVILGAVRVRLAGADERSGLAGPTAAHIARGARVTVAARHVGEGRASRQQHPRALGRVLLPASRMQFKPNAVKPDAVQTAPP